MMPLVVLLVAACQTLPPADLKPPTVSVSDLGIGDVGFERIRLVVTLAAHNPNDVDIPLSNLRVALSLLDQPLAQGAAVEPRLTLPKRASRDIPIEFDVPIGRLFDVARAAFSTDARLSYRLEGSANWGDTPVVVPFERRGELELLRRLRELFRLGAVDPYRRNTDSSPAGSV